MASNSVSVELYESKNISTATLKSDKAEWTLQSSSVNHAVSELAEVLPLVLNSFWRRSETRCVLICKPDSNLLKAINRAVSREINVDTCEIWEQDKLILKAPQSSLRSDVSRTFSSDIEQKIGGYASLDVILQTNVGQLAPDIAWWIVKPPRDRRFHPLRIGNSLELPDLWIEIAVNVGEDQRIAKEKMFSLRQHYADSIVFLLFVLPGDLTNTCLQRIHFNSAALPLANHQTHALRIQSASAGPYIRLWRIGLGGMKAITFVSSETNISPLILELVLPK
jgi:hypothetical protein